MQVIEYASLPNTKEVAYLSTIMKALGEIKRSNPTFKEYRDWLKEQMLWDKEAWPVVWPLLDVKVGERLHLGDFSEKLVATNDEAEARKLLYQRLLKRNEILCKYVFEALDERLHSTHELYRLITSYVYPGEYITLVNFQHWIKWMSAIGYIKFIGIRWGLSEIARDEIERIKQIDVEEILEDERLEKEAAKSRPAVDAAEASASPAPEPVAGGASAPTAAGVGFDPPDDDDFDGAEAHFVEEVDPDAMQAQAATSAASASASPRPASGAAPSASSAATVATAATGPAAAPVTISPLPRIEHRRYLIPQISADDLLANANRIKGWWAHYADKKSYQVSDFGLAAADFNADRAKFLFKVACIGRLIVHEEFAPVYYPFVEELQKRRIFDRLWAEESLEMILGECEFFEGNPWFAKAAESFVPFLSLRRRLKANASLADQLSDSRTGRELVTRLWEILYRRTLTIEPFFVVRELVRLGLWDNPAFETVAVVPTYVVRTNMFRLGFIDSLYADTFQQLIDAAEKLSRYFGPENNFEAPLALFDRGQGCAFRCGKTTTCEYACREKYGV